MTLPYLKEPAFLPDDRIVAHGFFGRKGGVSSGLYDSLNCGMGTQDDVANVTENRGRVATALGAGKMVSLKQVHGDTCLRVNAAFDDRPEGDAMVTDIPGVALGILTADCGPVLFYGEKDHGAPVIGAAHAGWGGALRGVLESTVKAMKDKGARAETIRACIGPCIGPKSYEVQAKFADPFLERDPAAEHFFRPAHRDGHLMFDLPGYIASSLAAAGVRYVAMTDIDTYRAEEDYFSYRRATHRAETDYGRQISAIVIR